MNGLSKFPIWSVLEVSCVTALCSEVCETWKQCKADIFLGWKPGTSIWGWHHHWHATKYGRRHTHGSGDCIYLVLCFLSLHILIWWPSDMCFELYCRSVALVFTLRHCRSNQWNNPVACFRQVTNGFKSIIGRSYALTQICKLFWGLLAECYSNQSYPVVFQTSWD